MFDKLLKSKGKHTKKKKRLRAVKTGTIRYRDDYGNWIPVIQNRDRKELKKCGMNFNYVGDTGLYKAWKNDDSIIINGFRYKVGRLNPFKKCIGYIITDDKHLVRLTKKVEFPKLIISCILVAALPFFAYKYLNSDNTWDMMLSRATSSESYRDNFNYSDQTVSLGSYITISNNSYNPVTLQYILYESGVKVFDTGELEPGEESNLKYGVYFETGNHTIDCETIAKSLDGVTVVENKKSQFNLNVRK